VVDSVSAALARRMLLAAQGFGVPRPTTVGTRQLGIAIDRLRLLQLDSVNVYERSHYQPVHARLGGYDKALLDRMTFRPKGGFTEYWAHEAALIPAADLPLFRWKMAALRAKDIAKGALPKTEGMLDWLLAYLADHGPTLATEVEHEANVGGGGWWGWNDVKHGLELLFRWGEVATAGRTRFQRTYALPSQVLPAAVLDAPGVPRADAIRELVRRSAVALGIGTVSDLMDYYRLRFDDTGAAVRELEEAGELVPVRVEGWRDRAWAHRDARRPRRVDTAALLSPFDPVVWDRERALRHWGFFYRIEIYTPAPKRVHGYYNLPILLDEQLVGRLDLKSDRQAGVLRVQSAWREDGPSGDAADPARIAALVRDAAAWQGLAGIEVSDRGTLTGDLRAALRGG